MKKTWIAIVILVILGVIVVQMFKTTISPENVVVSQTTVSEDSIVLKGDITSSAVGYKSYSVEETDGKLYVKLKGSSLNLTQSQGSFDISIKNNFEKIDEIYLQGDSSSETRLIWPEK